MKKMMKNGLLICLVLMLCIGLCACGESQQDVCAHTFGEWVVLKDSTCTENGVKFRKCTICSKEENEYIDPAHKWLDATCQSLKCCALCEVTEGEYADHKYQTGMCVWCGTFDPSEADNLTYDGGEVTITFVYAGNEKIREILDAAIADFNKLYPNIKIECHNGGDWDGCASTFNVYSELKPTVGIITDSYIWELQSNQKLLPLDTLIASNSQITLADGTTETLGLTQAQQNDYLYFTTADDGTYYSLPFSQYSAALNYDKAFFGEHNLSVPTTWEEMEALCTEIKRIDPSCSAPLGVRYSRSWFATMCEQMGADYKGTVDIPFSFNNASVAECVSLMRQWFKQGYITSEDVSYSMGKYMNIVYGGGFDFDGIAPIPQMNPTNPATPVYQRSICTSNTSDPQEAIAMWLLAKFLSTDPETQAAYSMAIGYTPVVRSAFSVDTYSQWLAQENNCYVSSIKLAYEQCDSYFTEPYAMKSSMAIDSIAQMLEKCLSQEIPGDVDAFIRKALDEAVQECI